ncbi:PTS system cellobiose-specific IIC component [Lactobacillus colini]|uniref:Permease IIC component n=1 Tax=Lactobacillus colini TaxID=1819254 RepID=A0ABS4MBX2_9LACO|nr:PTS transporter subunit EIIC [Lactobacillus colini]MBP2057186.1 PTS system cellobiose-specific IIC component [Lactobacillus colini]
MAASTTQNSGFRKFTDKFTEISVKIGNEVHLRSLRDAFATIMPMYILAGFGTLINSLILPYIFKGDTLAKWQVFGTAVTNGTLNISSILICSMIAYFLAKNKNFENAIGCIPVSLASLFALMAINSKTIPVGGKAAVTITNAVLYDSIGTKSMFGGIIVGLIATELFIKFSKVKAFKINLGSMVPPAVGKSFTVLIPSLLIVTIFAIIAAIFAAFNTDLISLISMIIQEPLRKLNTSLAGFLLIYSTGNFLFTLGIHQTVINGTLLDPVNLINMNENMAAVAHGKMPTHIINSDFVTVYTQMGGTGLTISLILAVLIASHYSPFRKVVNLALVPGIFEINEPIIFGFPIVFNIPMMIPFVLSPVIGGLIGYFATATGFVKPLSVYLPWTTPPFISGFLASGGDWKVVFVQIIIIIITTLFYIPFIKIAEKVAKKSAELSI